MDTNIESEVNKKWREYAAACDKEATFGPYPRFCQQGNHYFGFYKRNNGYYAQIEVTPIGIELLDNLPSPISSYSGKTITSEVFMKEISDILLRIKQIIQ